MTINLDAEAGTREEDNPVPIAALDKAGLSEVESSWGLDVINDAERGRWVAVLGADAIAELTYRYLGGRVVLLSTWVDHAYRNHRVATELVARVLHEIRESGKKITIICPVVGEFIAATWNTLTSSTRSIPGRRLPRARTRGGSARQAAHRVRARRDVAVRRSDVVRVVQRVRDGRLRTDIGNVAALGDVVAACNPTERAVGKAIIRVRQ